MTVHEMGVPMDSDMWDFLLALVIVVFVVINAGIILLFTVTVGWPFMLPSMKRRRLESALSAARRRSPASPDLRDLAAAVDTWATVQMPLKRKQALISAGIPASAARSKETRALSDNDLQVMSALQSNSYSR